MQAMATQNQATGGSSAACHLLITGDFEDIFLTNVNQPYLHLSVRIILEETLVVSIFRQRPVHPDFTVDHRFNPYNAELFLYKLWRPKGIFSI